MLPSEFADSVDIDRSSYTKIEKGEKPLHQYMAFEICDRYSVTMEYLYRNQLSDFALPTNLANEIRARLREQNR